MNGAENQHITEREDLLEELFRHASARERPPPDDEAAIREALHAEWRVITGRRRRRRTALSLAAAASLVLAVLIGTNMQRGPQVTTPAEQLASIQKVTGKVGRAHGVGEPDIGKKSTQTQQLPSLIFQHWKPFGNRRATIQNFGAFSGQPLA